MHLSDLSISRSDKSNRTVCYRGFVVGCPTTRNVFFKENTVSTKDHNKGQSDRSNNTYDPPVGVLEDFLTWSPSGVRENAERNSDYRDGWTHTDKQKG